VSLLLRDRYVAVLSPERVAIVRRRRGWNGDFDLQADAPCAAPTAAAAAEALAGLLAQPQIGKGDLTVVLSNHFVHYLLVPWRDEVGNPTELAAFADICCDEVFGSASGGRVLLTSPEKASSPRLAAALDAAFMNTVRTVVAASPLRLVSVQPYLAAAFNRLRESLGRGDFLLVVAEPARSCLLVSTGGRWSSVRTTAGEDAPQALAALVEREAQLTGLAEEGMPPIFVHAPGQAGLQLPDCHGVRPATLSLPMAISQARPADPLVAMAMTVA
jgi:hypothetical protein